MLWIIKKETLKQLIQEFENINRSRKTKECAYQNM
jgi:hypothetical protein